MIERWILVENEKEQKMVLKSLFANGYRRSDKTMTYWKFSIFPGAIHIRLDEKIILGGQCDANNHNFKNELLNTEELNEIGINCLYTASKLGLL